MVGAGLQSAIVIAIFRTYEEIKKDGAIFAIEEPEVYLHPQKQRYFSSILSGLANNNQVFITTHSPVFVRLYEPENVCLIRRNATDGTTAKLCAKEEILTSEKEALKIENYFDNQRNEMFFAKGVVFVEGATEKFTFPYAGRILNIDLDRYGISVIECGGKGNLLTFAKVASAFGIPYVVVADEDIRETSLIQDPEKKRKIEERNADDKRKNDALKGFVPSDQMFWMVPNIEAVMGISENNDNKIKQALIYLKSKQEKKDIAEEIQNPINKILSMVGISTTTQSQ
jgi:predicted ATP-dependent endonuclease of OLD family